MPDWFINKLPVITQTSVNSLNMVSFESDVPEIAERLAGKKKWILTNNSKQTDRTS